MLFNKKTQYDYTLIEPHSNSYNAQTLQQIPYLDRNIAQLICATHVKVLASLALLLQTRYKASTLTKRTFPVCVQR